jgi:hypothetical protein
MEMDHVLLDYGLDNLMCEVLSSSERYLDCQQRVTECMSKAFLGISKARKNCVHIAAPDDIRSDFEANVTLVTEEGGKVGICEDVANPMLMLCALPPPALKQAKNELLLALRILTGAVNDVHHIMQVCETLEVSRGIRDPSDCPSTEFLERGFTTSSVPMGELTASESTASQISNLTKAVRDKDSELSIFEQLSKVVPISVDLDSSDDDDNVE